MADWRASGPLSRLLLCVVILATASYGSLCGPGSFYVDRPPGAPDAQHRPAPPFLWGDQCSRLANVTDVNSGAVALIDVALVSHRDPLLLLTDGVPGRRAALRAAAKRDCNVLAHQRAVSKRAAHAGVRALGPTRQRQVWCLQPGAAARASVRAHRIGRCGAVPPPAHACSRGCSLRAARVRHACKWNRALLGRRQVSSAVHRCDRLCFTATAAPLSAFCSCSSQRASMCRWARAWRIPARSWPTAPPSASAGAAPAEGHTLHTP
jgi:hypothetical protein